MNIVETRFGEFFISTDRAKMDLVAIHDYLSNYSDWSRNIPIDRVEKALDHSLNFGLFKSQKQIGFARIISDFSTIAYVGDIYILEEFRGQGLSIKMMDAIMNHPDLQGLRRWILLTSTADWLYRKYGFQKLPAPELYMELYNPSVYKLV